MNKLLRLATLLKAYVSERYFPARTALSLQSRQRRRLARHLDWLAGQNSYWRERLGSKYESPQTRLLRLPVLDKAAWLAQFDHANTAGLRLEKVQAAALRAEQERDFVPTVDGVTVGLSSGTSGSRGVFVVSAQEQARWAGTVLGRLLPRGLLAGERIAFFLRANSNLYTSVKSRHIAFEFFDLLESFEDHVQRLLAFTPSVIVAPAQVLRALALHPQSARWASCTVVSVAEVLEPPVRQLLENHFFQVREVYQATEGLLALSCEHGALHLNEEHLWIEREWLDAQRFVPIVTDLARRTQPLLRYRLTDVLCADIKPCRCGRATTVLAAIEGRADDQLVLPGRDAKPHVVFADAVSRVLALGLPLAADYELTQRGNTLTLATTADSACTQRAFEAVQGLLANYGIDAQALHWVLLPDQAFEMRSDVKRRRIRRLTE